MEEYLSYGKIQEHMKVSELLYEIDKLGKHLLEEICKCKNTKVGRRGILLNKDYDIIYNSINETINVQRFKSRLFLTLQYYLDEALFDITPEIVDSFYIEDDSYDLTKLYFDQEQWMRNVSIQKFQLTPAQDLIAEDSLLINCFFVKYESLIQSIEILLGDIDEDKRYKRKITQVLSRIRNKHAPATAVILEAIKTDVEL